MEYNVGAKEEETWSQAALCMNPGDVMLSHTSQAQKVKYSSILTYYVTPGLQRGPESFPPQATR